MIHDMENVKNYILTSVIHLDLIWSRKDVQTEAEKTDLFMKFAFGLLHIQ